MSRVIALSGPPGAGKSTLGRLLARRLGAARIDYDDYETQTRISVEALRAWTARGAPFAEIAFPGLPEALEAARAQGPVVFENPLGRAHPALAPLIDRSVWLDCPPDVALVRKIATFLNAERAAGSPPAAALHRLEGYLGAYAAGVHNILKIQEDRVRPLADMVVATTAGPEAAADEILARSGLF